MNPPTLPAVVAAILRDHFRGHTMLQIAHDNGVQYNLVRTILVRQGVKPNLVPYRGPRNHSLPKELGNVLDDDFDA